MSMVMNRAPGVEMMQLNKNFATNISVVGVATL